MKLSDTNQYIKDSLQDIIDGALDDKFSSDELKKILELSFFLNHISFDEMCDALTFKYNNITLKVSNVIDLVYSNIYMSEEEIFSIIMHEEMFKSAYTTFLRDIKIDNILK